MLQQHIAPSNIRSTRARPGTLSRAEAQALWAEIQDAPIADLDDIILTGCVPSADYSGSITMSQHRAWNAAREEHLKARRRARRGAR